MLLTLAGDAVRNRWTLCVAGEVLPLAQGAVCGLLCALSVSWRALRSWKLRPTGEDASQRRPGGRPEHLHKTGTEPGHMPGAQVSTIGVFTAGCKHCQSFAAVRWWNSCRLCALAGYSPVR